jgi:hypothetical protein
VHGRIALGKGVMLSLHEANQRVHFVPAELSHGLPAEFVRTLLSRPGQAGQASVASHKRDYQDSGPPSPQPPDRVGMFTDGRLRFLHHGWLLIDMTRTTDGCDSRQARRYRQNLQHITAPSLETRLGLRLADWVAEVCHARIQTRSLRKEGYAG